MSRRTWAWIMCLAITGCAAEPTPPTGGGHRADARARVAPDAAADRGPPDGRRLDDAVKQRPTGDAAVRSDSAGPALRAGAASVTLALPRGVPLGGYGAAPRRRTDALSIAMQIAGLAGRCIDPTPADPASFFSPSTAQHDPLRARAVVLERGRTRLALLRIDAVAVSRKLRDELVAHARTLGIAPAALLVAATHTHSGPGAVSDRRLWQLLAMDCFHAGAYRAVVTAAERALDRAVASLQPASLGVGVTEVKGVTHNRSGRPGIVDRHLTLIKITTAPGTPLAAVVSFAIHGTCLGASNLELSADVSGQLESALAQKLRVSPLFLNGAEGDVAPSKGGHAGAKQLGAVIATAAASLWKRTSVRSDATLAATAADVPMGTPSFNGCPPLIDFVPAICQLITDNLLPLSRWMPSKLPFAALRIGDLALATIPGEPITEIGRQIRAAGKALGFGHTAVVGLANDYMGYVTTPAEYRRYSYEARMTLYGRTTGTLAVQAATARLAALKALRASP